MRPGGSAAQVSAHGRRRGRGIADRSDHGGGRRLRPLEWRAVDVELARDTVVDFHDG
jgi:hypothetical protein